MNNLKKILLLMFLFSNALFYGQRDVDKDKIKTLKIAYLTEKLNLTSKEAQTFWPIYNDYQEEKQKLRNKGSVKIISKIKDAENVSEKDAAQLLDKVILYEVEENKIFENFIAKITKVISSKKTLVLLRSEEDFKRQLIRQYHEKNKKNEP
jgi:hypothetical protein